MVSRTVQAMRPSLASSLPEALTPERARERLGQHAWLDVRDERAFASGHVPGSGNVPLVMWGKRRHECPPRETPTLVIAAIPDEARDAATRLAGSGQSRVAWLDAPWTALGVAAVQGPAAQLWRPAPLLERVLAGQPRGRARGRALDVACGSGRDAVTLALEGYDVQAWDHDVSALDRARDLADRHGVRLHTVAADLEALVPPAFDEAAFALVTCFRYLHRPLLPALERAVAPGGTLIYETYREGQEWIGRPRRPRFLLRSGELREAFPSLELLEYDEPSPPGGPLTARLVARRPER